MSYEQQERKPGSGVLYTNHKKKSDKHPDWTGEIKLSKDCVEGEVLKISAWTKHSARGALISIKEDTWKPDPNYRQNVQPVPSKSLDDLDSALPF